MLRIAVLGRAPPAWRLLARLSTQATTTPPTTTPPILPRILAFSAFSLTLSLGALAYTLVTDESKLFWARDNFPRTVNLVAPLLGLPQEAISGGNSSELVFSPDEDEENMVTDIKQVVGDSVYVCIKLASGQVLIEQCGADETSEALKRRVLQGRAPGDRVLDVSILDDARAQQLLLKTSEELAREMNHVPIPEIPTVLSVNSVGVALELCRQTELDLTVRLRLSQNEADRININRALKEIDARKVELKRLLKEERSKLGVQSIFRRGR